MENAFIISSRYASTPSEPIISRKQNQSIYQWPLNFNYKARLCWLSYVDWDFCHLKSTSLFSVSLDAFNFEVYLWHVRNVGLHWSSMYGCLRIVCLESFSSFQIHSLKDLFSFALLILLKHKAVRLLCIFLPTNHLFKYLICIKRIFH